MVSEVLNTYDMESVTTVLMDINGGIGDVLCYYYNLVSDGYPYPDCFYKLKCFKTKYPRIKTILVSNGWNYRIVSDFLRFNPYVDLVMYKNNFLAKDLHTERNSTNISSLLSARAVDRDTWISNDFVNSSNVCLFPDIVRFLDDELESNVDHGVYISKEDYEGISKWEGQEYVIVHPFAADKFRSCEYIDKIDGYNAYPDFHYAALCNLLGETGYQVLLMGSESEDLPFDSMHSNVHNLAGEINIRQSVYLTERCEGLIGSNSAMSCVTFATEIPTIVITPSYCLTRSDFGRLDNNMPEHVEKWGNMTDNPNKGPQIKKHLESTKRSDFYVIYERPNYLYDLNPREIVEKFRKMTVSGDPHGNTPERMKLCEG